MVFLCNQLPQSVGTVRLPSVLERSRKPHSEIPCYQGAPVYSMVQKFGLPFRADQGCADGQEKPPEDSMSSLGCSTVGTIVCASI